MYKIIYPIDFKCPHPFSLKMQMKICDKCTKTGGKKTADRGETLLTGAMAINLDMAEEIVFNII